MAGGKKLFKKGQSGNPNGRPLTSPEFRAARKLSVEEFKDLSAFTLTAGESESVAIVNDPKESNIKVGLAKAMLAFRLTGDIKIIQYLLDRLYGKVKEAIDLTVYKPSVLVKTDGTRVEFLNRPSDENDEEN